MEHVQTGTTDGHLWQVHWVSSNNVASCTNLGMHCGSMRIGMSCDWFPLNFSLV